MKRMGVVVAGILTCLLAGCTEPTPREETERPVEVTVLAMDPEGRAPAHYVALSDKPIHLGAFTSWYGRGADGSLVEEVTDEVPPGSVYLALTGQSGCVVPEGIEVFRTGDRLRYLFTGGDQAEVCERHHGPVMYLALPGDAVEGVRTIGEQEPIDPAGPGKLTDLVPLGTGRFDPVPPAELHTDGIAAFRAGVLAARPHHADEITTALELPVRGKERGFAFVLPGCQMTDAVLVLGPDRIAAEPAPAEDQVACAAPEFYLATFLVRAKHVPEGASLTN